MKDELAGEMPGWTSFAEAKTSIDRWMEYYNRDRCQWDLAKLSPNEYYATSPQANTPTACCRHGSNEFVLDLGSSSSMLWVKRGEYS